MSVDPYRKAYGRRHRRARDYLLPRAIGKPCPVCHLPMQAGQALDLGHSTHALKEAGEPGDRIEHASCNRLDLEHRTATRPAKVDNRLPPASRNW